MILQPGVYFLWLKFMLQASLLQQKELSHLTDAIFKFFWRQVWVSFHMQVPAI